MMYRLPRRIGKETYLMDLRERVVRACDEQQGTRGNKFLQLILSALRAITASDAERWFNHSGYRYTQQSMRKCYSGDRRTRVRAAT